MQITVNGNASKDFTPDQVCGSVTFKFRADTYQEALKGGVAVVRAYIEDIAEHTDFKPEDFKTNAYSIREEIITNRLAPKSIEDLNKKLEKRISNGFHFSQYISLTFDYDRERLAKLLIYSSQIPNVPALNIMFSLKDIEESRRSLIPDAYNDAHMKAKTLAESAGKHLRDCVRVDIDMNSFDSGAARGSMLYRKQSMRTYDDDDMIETLKDIDETFKPDDITLSKTIACIWETSD